MTVPSKTGTPPVASPRREDRRTRWLRWMLILLLLLLVTICCLWLVSQLALFGLGRPSVDESVDTALRATYSAWQNGRFNPVYPALIQTIRAEQLTAMVAPGLGTEIPLVPLTALPPLTSIAQLSTGTPTRTPTQSPTPTATPTRTPTPVLPGGGGPLPTRTPTATITPLVTATNTPAPPPPPPPTPTPIPPPTMQFSTASFITDEGAGQIVVTVTLSYPSPGGITVNYSTGGGSATGGGVDYGPPSGTGMLTFPAGSTTQTFTIPIINDGLLEGDENFNVTLSGVVGATLVGTNPATVTILDSGAAVVPPCGTSTAGAGEPDIGAPNGIDLALPVGSCHIVNLTGAFAIVPDGNTSATDWEIYYYELVSGVGFIAADNVIIQIGTTATGPWITVYSWYDGTLDFNTSIGQGGCAGCAGTLEEDNVVGPAAGNLRTVGAYYAIAINVDPFTTPLTSYQYLRIYSPTALGLAADATADPDAFQIIP